MARTVVLTCDKCSRAEGVETYSIGRAGATPYEIDLCGECAAVLDELVDLGREAVAGLSRHATSASREPELRTKIHTPEELDKMEEEYRRAARRKK